MIKTNNVNNHTAVRTDEVIKALNIQRNGIYVDCTFGRGGHSLAILKEINQNGKLFVFDWDQTAHTFFVTNFQKYMNCFFINDNFKNLKKRLNELGIEKVDGFLFDLGVSSPMLNQSQRGFSYTKDAKLDMRMNQNQTLSAYQVINDYSAEKLLYLFKKYGEIKNPYPVVKSIVEERLKKPIESTLELVEIIRNKTPIKLQRTQKHFARTYFQAIRIEVNDELNNLRKGLLNALAMLKVGGRIVTISFHSLEEREIKLVYQKVLQPQIPKEVPINNQSDFKIVKISPRRTSAFEISQNRRSRSSIIKVIERVRDAG